MKVIVFLKYEVLDVFNDFKSPIPQIDSFIMIDDELYYVLSIVYDITSQDYDVQIFVEIREDWYNRRGQSRKN